MRLKPKVLAAMGAMVALMVVVNLVVLQYMVLPGFERVQKHVAETHAEQAAEALYDAIRTLGHTATDWSRWDDPYRFAGGEDSTFVNNVTPQAIDTINVTVLAIYDVSGRLVQGWARAGDGFTALPAEFVPGQPQFLKSLMAHERPDGAIEGIVPTAQGPMLAAARIILDSNHRGPGRGTFLLARPLDESVIEQVREHARLPVVIGPIDGERQPIVQTAMRREDMGEVLTQVGAAQTSVYRTLRSIDGAPMLLMQVDTTNQVLALGNSTLSYGILSVVLVGLFDMALIWMLLSRLVLRPVSDLAAYVHRVSRTGRLDERLPVGRADEFGILARAFNAMEERLDANRRQLEDFTEAASDWAWEIDRELRVTFLSNGFEEKAGLPRGALLGKTMEELTQDDDPVEGGSVILKLMKAHKPFRHIRVRRTFANGRRPYLLMNGKPLFDAGGEFLGYRGTCADITEWCLLEQRQAELERQLREARRLQALGTLAGGLAHELNNALTPVGGMAEILLDDLPQGGSSHECAQVIHEAALRAHDLVEQLLAFSRGERARRRAVDPALVVDDAIRRIRPDLPAGVALETHTEGDGVRVEANPGQLEDVIVALLRNAADALGSRPGHIAVALSRVAIADDDVTLLPAGGYARLTVRDDGCGMDEATRARALEPLFTTKEVGRGKGLGLSLAYSIAVSHGGTLTLESERGQGTTVHVLLPVAPADAAGFDGAAAADVGRPTVFQAELPPGPHP